MSELSELVERLARPESKRRLWGVIATVNTGPPSTLDVRLSGSTAVTPGLRYRDNLYSPVAGQVVEVVREDRDLVVVGRLASTVPTAPTGDPGPPGDTTPYVHTQTVPAATWTVTHTLGHYPAAVSIVDSAGTQVEGDVHYDSTSQVTLSFGAAFAGVAYLL